MIHLPAFSLASATPTGAATAADPITSLLSLVVPVVLMFGVMWFILIRPQRKRDKELKNQLGSMVVGDEAVTIGGVVGKVAALKDDEVTLATGPSKTMITFKKSAIQSIKKPLSD